MPYLYCHLVCILNRTLYILYRCVIWWMIVVMEVTRKDAQICSNAGQSLFITRKKKSVRKIASNIFPWYQTADWPVFDNEHSKTRIKQVWETLLTSPVTPTIYSDVTLYPFLLMARSESSKYIAFDQRCDGKHDCNDSSDECQGCEVS